MVEEVPSGLNANASYGYGGIPTQTTSLQRLAAPNVITGAIGIIALDC